MVHLQMLKYEIFYMSTITKNMELQNTILYENDICDLGSHINDTYNSILQLRDLCIVRCIYAISLTWICSCMLQLNIWY